MNQNMYGFAPSSTESFGQIPSHVQYAAPANTTMQPGIHYPPQVQQANVPMQHTRPEMQRGWNYPHPPQPTSIIAPGQPIPSQTVVAGSQPIPTPGPQFHPNVSNTQKQWQQSNNPVLLPKPRDSMGVVHLDEDFSEDFNEAELFQGQPVMRQAPNTAFDESKTTNYKYSNSPIKERIKVIEDKVDDEDDEEEEEPEVDDTKEELKDPCFNPEEEDEEEYVPDMSGSDEDFSIGRKRKPRKSGAAQRVTRSQSVNSRKGGNRSGRRKSRKRLSDEESDLDDDDDDYVTMPIKRGQPSMNRSYDLSDDDYIPSRPRKSSSSKKPAARRGRPRTRSIPQIKVVYESDEDSFGEISDSDEEEIFLERGQPVGNKRKASKCSEPPKSHSRKENGGVVFLVERELSEAIRNLSEDCPYSEDNHIWRLENLQLQKFQQMENSNCFRATSLIVQYSESDASSYLPLNVQFLENPEYQVVKLKDPAVPYDQPQVKKRRGRPPNPNKAKLEPKTPPKGTPGRRRGRPPKSSQVAAPTEVPAILPVSSALQPTAEQPEDPLQCLADRSFVAAVVKEQARRLSVLEVGSLDKTAELVNFERCLAILKSKLLEGFKLAPAYLAALSAKPSVKIQPCSEERMCEGFLDHNVPAELQIQLEEKSTSADGSDKDKAKSSFSVCKLLGDRSSIWHSLHHQQHNMLQDLKNHMDSNKQQEPARPAQESDGASTETVVRDLINCLVDKVSGTEEMKPGNDETQKKTSTLDDDKFIELITSKLFANLTAALETVKMPLTTVGAQ